MTASSNSSVVQRLGTYLAAAGGAGLAAGAADAAVTKIDVVHTETVSNTSSNYYVDLDGDTNSDIYFYISDSGGSGSIWVYETGSANVEFYGPAAPCGNYYAGNVASGTTVNATLLDSGNSDGYANILSRYSPSCDHFEPFQWGILAFRFDPAGGTNWQYGYLNIRPRTGSTILDIQNGAYESTQGVGITANGVGPTSIPVGPAVPIGVSLLIAGAAALRHRRQNKTH